MTNITITRTDLAPITEQEKPVLRRVLMGLFNGFTREDQKAWGKFWKRLMGMEQGELVNVAMTFERSSPYHRRHMAIEQSVFDAQERFDQFEQFRYWLKVGAGWVTWAAGPKGGVVPIPKSISYHKAEQTDFEQYHAETIKFLRGPHAANYLWPHLKGARAAEMINAILMEFDE